MKKSDIKPMPEYFDHYINLSDDVELLQAFDKSFEQLENLDIEKLKKLGGKIYAPDKWTVKTIIQHLTDFERILCYRTLLFARKDKNIRQGIDENFIAKTAKADERNIEEIINELKTVRLASRALFANFDEEMLLNTGLNWKYEVSVLAMGFNIVGHQIHHFNIIEDGYFPLLKH